MLKYRESGSISLSQSDYRKEMDERMREWK